MYITITLMPYTKPSLPVRSISCTKVVRMIGYLKIVSTTRNGICRIGRCSKRANCALVSTLAKGDSELKLITGPADHNGTSRSGPHISLKVPQPSKVGLKVPGRHVKRGAREYSLEHRTVVATSRRARQGNF
jgi:hypothetical protein